MICFLTWGQMTEEPHPSATVATSLMGGVWCKHLRMASNCLSLHFKQQWEREARSISLITKYDLIKFLLSQSVIKQIALKRTQWVLPWKKCVEGKGNVFNVLEWTIKH